MACCQLYGNACTTDTDCCQWDPYKNNNAGANATVICCPSNTGHAGQCHVSNAC